MGLPERVAGSPSIEPATARCVSASVQPPVVAYSMCRTWQSNQYVTVPTSIFCPAINVAVMPEAEAVVKRGAGERTPAGASNGFS